MISVGDLTLDTARRLLSRPGTLEPVRLKPQLATTLHLFMQHSGAVVTSDQILTALYPNGRDTESDSTIVAVCIGKCRNALLAAGIPRHKIRTVYQRGYILDMPTPRILLTVTAEQLAALDVLIAQAPPHVRRAAELLKGIGK